MGREIALEARPGHEPAIAVEPGTRTDPGPAMIEAPELRITSPAPREVWRQLLAADGDALVSQSPEWLDALCASGGYEDASLLYETPRGTRLLLPMVRRSGWPPRFAPRASMPDAWGMGGVLAETPATPADLEAVAADLASEPALRISIRPNPLQADLWATADRRGAVTIPRLAHVLEVDGGAEQVWKRMRSSARSGIRKAERAGLEIKRDTTGRLVPVFHGLLQLSIERWAGQQNEPLPLARWRGARRDPLRKFERIAAEVGDAMRVWVAWKDGSPVASIIVLQGANAHYTRGAMNKELAGPTNANDLLHWLAIQDACAAGCRSYHMGDSGSSGSLARFKSKFGARPIEYAEYRIERLPLTRADALARGLVKRALRFRDA